jgi:transposase-like protein
MEERKSELVRLLAQECGSIQDIHQLLKSLFKETIEQMLEAEMDEHLGYEKHSSMGDLSGNSRNGYNQKTLQTELGKAGCGSKLITVLFLFQISTVFSFNPPAIR